MTGTLRAVSWPIVGTGVKRCQWVERNRRCKAAPAHDVALYFDPPTDQPRGQLVCEEHRGLLSLGRWPQRWSAPESSWMWSGRGLVILQRPGR